MKVLVTGSSGLIGSAFCEAAEKDYDLKRFEGDITRREDVLRNLRDVDTVVHFAALTYVPPSWENPHEYMRVNYGGTLHFLENHRMFSKFVYISTSHIMGNQRELPIRAESEAAPRDPYSVSKKAATDAVKLYSERFNFDSLIVRPYNCFGPRQSKNFVVPTMTLQALSKGNIVLHGDTQKELVFVKDMARAIKGLLDTRARGEIQVCKGVTYRISDIASMILAELGFDPSNVEVLPTDRPSWDILKLQGDPEPLKKALPGFTFTPMGDALRQTIDWYRENR